MTKKRNRVFLLMILPSIVGFLLLYILPTAMSFMYSLTNWSVYNRTIQFTGLTNFQKIFMDAKTLAHSKIQ